MSFRSITVVSTPAHPLVVTPPSGIADGDLLIAWAFSDSTNALGITAGGVTRTAGAFVVGATYTIVSVGTTNWVAIGASANTIGVTFVATGVGSGTGTATGGFTSFTGLEVVLSSGTSDGGSFWAGWAEAASESGNYSIVNANGIVMNGGVLCMTGKAATAFINQQILATQQTSQASPWTIAAGNYAAPTDAMCDEVMIGFSDNGPPGGAVSHTTPSGSGWNMRAGATGMSDGAFVNGFVATRDGVAAGATGGNSSVGTLAATSAGWSAVLVAIKQAGGGVAAATTSPPYRQPVPMRPGPNGFTRGRVFRGDTSNPVPATATATGLSSLVLPLSGAATVTVLAQAASIVALPLSGASTATDLVQAASSVSLPLAGAATAAVLVQGSSSVSLPLAGAATGTVLVQAASTISLPLTGSATLTVGPCTVPAYQMAIPMRPGGGGLVIGRPFQGSTSNPVPLSATATGVSSLTLPLSGSATATVLVQGASSVSLPLAGAAAGTVLAQASSTVSLPLSASATGTVLVQATSSVPLPLTGSATGNIGAVAVGDSNRTLPLSGVVAGTVLVQAASSLPLPLVGVCVVTVLVRGASMLALPLSGSATGHVGGGVVTLGPRPLSVARQNGTRGTGNFTLWRNPST